MTKPFTFCCLLQAKLSIWNNMCWQEFTWCQLTSSNLKTKVVKQFTQIPSVWGLGGVKSVRPDQQLRGQSLWSVLPTGKIQTDTQCHNCCQHNQGLSLVNWQWSLLLICFINKQKTRDHSKFSGHWDQSPLIWFILMKLWNKDR